MREGRAGSDVAWKMEDLRETLAKFATLQATDPIIRLSGQEQYLKHRIGIMAPDSNILTLSNF